MITFSATGPDGKRLGSIEISCIEARGRQPDSVNVYEAVITYPRPIEWLGDPHGALRRRNVTFEHRFGDPWPVLVREAIEAMEVTP